MKKILLTWANGMLAYDFQKYCTTDLEIVGFDKDELDITSREQVEHVVKAVNPDIILNCAAYTNVDEAEDTETFLNFQVNALGVYHLANIAKEQHCDLITLSTDYVFEGKKESWYQPMDSCNPLNAYGLAKHLWEKLAKTAFPSTIIVRTSWLYGWWPAFKNFPNTMLHLAETKNAINVVNDQFGLPTFTKDLVVALKTVIKQIKRWRGSIFHFSNAWKEAISWYTFATEIFRLTWKDISLFPCASSAFPTKAQRPKFSKLLNESEVQLRHWKEGIEEYVTSVLMK